MPRALGEDEFLAMMHETNATSAQYVKLLGEINDNLETLIHILQAEQSKPTQLSVSIKESDRIKPLMTVCSMKLKNIKGAPLDHCKKLVVQLTFLEYQNEEWRKKNHLSMLKYLGDPNKVAFVKTPAHVVPLHFTRWREDSSNNYRNQQQPAPSIVESEQDSPPAEAEPMEEMNLFDVQYPTYLKETPARKGEKEPEKKLNEHSDVETDESDGNEGESSESVSQCEEEEEC
jgi:hypothetical protein